MAQASRENLEQLIATHQPALKSFIRRQVENREDAEDILQDVFYQLVKTVDATLNPVEEVSAWLYRVARNMIINLRIRKREEEMPAYHDSEIMEDITEVLFSAEATAPSPETEYLRSLVWEELEDALAGLPPEQREIFELTEFDGFPVKEIAATTGLPVNTLLSRKHYAVLHLRKRLKALYDDLCKP